MEFAQIISIVLGACRQDGGWGGGAVHGSEHRKQDLHHCYVNHAMANDSNARKTLEAACALFSFLIH